MPDVRALADLLAARGPALVLTGAGVSTESGIPDFRSPTGIWAQFDPLEYASLAAFRRDPEKVWRFYAPRFERVGGAEPNAAHQALAELEHLGHVRAVVTQNIDLLHRRAGSREVLEVHGSIATSTCPSCGGAYSLEEVAGLLAAGDGAPRCERCEVVLKPGVVFFGEALPPEVIDRAYELARSTPLCLVVGSTLEVYPVAELPLEVVTRGGALAIVNRGPTALDAYADVRVEASAGEVLAEVAALLRG